MQYQSVPLTEQIDYFSTLYEEMKQQLGASFVQDLLSKSLFPIVIGGNDIFAYFLSSTLQKKISPQQYVDSMGLKLNEQLKVTK